MSAKIVLLPPEVCIVNHLCAELATLEGAVLARSAVLLPTRRLVIFCLAALAERHTAFEAPLMTTLDGFLMRLDEGGATVVVPQHVEQIVKMLLARDNYQYLQPAFAHEMCQLFNDLLADAGHVHFQEKVTQQLAQNPWLAEGEIAQQQEKYQELQRLYLSLQAQLQDDGHTAPALAHATALSNAAQELQSREFAHIYVAAFTSLNKTDGVFLRELAERGGITFYCNRAACEQPNSPTAALLSVLSPVVEVQKPSTVQTSDNARMAERVSILRFASPLVEVTCALHSAARLLEAGGVRPAEIAIVLSRDAYYLPHLLAVVDFFAFAKNIALPIPLRMTSIGSFLQALSSYVCDDFKVPAAIDIVAHPFFAAQERDAAIHALSKRHRRGKLKAQPNSNTPVNVALLQIEALVQRGKKRTLRQQLDELQQLLHELQCYQWAAREDFELQSVEDIFTFLQNLSASSLSETKFTTQEFWQFVSEKFLTLPLRKVGEPLAGVQILSLPEVRAMPFQHVLVVGCHEGFFPKALPRDVVISDKLKTAIGLNGWQQLEAMEDVTFNGLLLSDAQLTLSYCQSSAERSRFIEKIVRTQALVEQDCTGLALTELLPATATMPHTQESNAFSAPHFFTEVSASSAESFIRCPLRHTLHKLDIAATVCELRAQDSPLEEGSQLHQIIETFSNSPAYQRICHEVSAHGERVAQLSELLNSITAQCVPLLNNQALATHLRFFAWPRLAAFVSHKNALPDYQEKHEYELERHDALSWFGGKQCALRGKIDHIHEDHEHLLLLDYKRKSLPENKELDTAIAMQLAFYAYALECERAAEGKGTRLATTVTGYYSILSGEFTPVACGADITVDFLRPRFNCRVKKTRSLEALIAEMQDLLNFRSSQPDVYSTADPSFCGGCQFDNLCRKNDPAQQEQIANQNYLQAYLLQK